MPVPTTSTMIPPLPTPGMDIIISVSNTTSDENHVSDSGVA